MMFPVAIAPAWNLGKFRPRLTSRRQVKERLSEFIAGRADAWLKSEVTVREPNGYYRRPEDPTRIMGEGQDSVNLWHSDGSPYGEAFYLAVWSNGLGSEFVHHPAGQKGKRIRQDRRIYQADPFDVILFDNREFYHRSPIGTDEDYENRWFARFHVPYWGNVKGEALTFVEVPDKINLWMGLDSEYSPW